mgnify:CR=1 FL=1
MKKSELRSLIREVLQEELAKARVLTEALIVDKASADNRSRPNPVLSGGL